MVATIGSLSNVPNPGSPITSPWAQDVTRLGVHVFATKAALDAASTAPNWPGLANGALAVTLDTNTLWQRAAGAWKTGGGRRRLGHVTRTTNYTLNTPDVTVAVDIFPPLTFTSDGTPVTVEFYCSRSDTGGSAGASNVAQIIRNGSAAGIVAVNGPAVAGGSATASLFGRFEITPSAGSVTFNARGVYSVAGNGTFYGGTAGAGFVPMTLSVFSADAT